MGFINIGFGNIINDDKIITIVSPDSAPARRFVQNAKEKDMVIDATHKSNNNNGFRIHCPVSAAA